jgi:hypothetical protein
VVVVLATVGGAEFTQTALALIYIYRSAVCCSNKDVYSKDKGKGPPDGSGTRAVIFVSPHDSSI